MIPAGVYCKSHVISVSCGFGVSSLKYECGKFFLTERAHFSGSNELRNLEIKELITELLNQLCQKLDPNSVYRRKTDADPLYHFARLPYPESDNVHGPPERWLQAQPARQKPGFPAFDFCPQTLAVSDVCSSGMLIARSVCPGAH